MTDDAPTDDEHRRETNDAGDIPMPTVPDQLRRIADRLDADDDTQLIATVIGVDATPDGSAPKTYARHCVSAELDELSFEQTIAVIEHLNVVGTNALFTVGLGDAVRRETDRAAVVAKANPSREALDELDSILSNLGLGENADDGESDGT